MAEKSVGVTGGIHRRMQQIKKDNPDVTISGFACYAVDDVLSRKSSVNKIIERIAKDEAEGLGARRLDRRRFGS